MQTLRYDDMHKLVRSLPAPLFKLLKDDPQLLLAGGAIRAVISGEPVNDWDLFGPTRHALDATMQKLAADYYRANLPSKTHKSANAITVLAPPRAPVQAITRWLYTKPEDLVDSFDYSVARAAIWFEGGKWRSLADPRFYSDLAARRLHYCTPTRDEDPGGSIMRAVKFLKRGYSISPESLGQVIARLCAGIRSEDLSDSITLPRVLTALLREVDPLTVVDGLDMNDDGYVGPATSPDTESTP